jgi:hypothetical protein
MTRILPVAASLVIAATVAALLATGGGASAAQKPAKFRQVLATKLGAQLGKPADQVLAALKGNRAAKTPAERRRNRVKPDRAKVRAAREAWAAAVAKPLSLDPAKVTAALRALIAERLDSLVGDGWLTTAQRDAKLACFDGAPSCKGPGPWVGFLRVK